MTTRSSPRLWTAVCAGIVALSACTSAPESTGHIFAICDAVEGSLLDTSSDRFGGPTNEGQVQWALDGCAVRTDMVFDVRGDDHCGYGEVRMISIGRPLGARVGPDWSDLFLWNPGGVVEGIPEAETIDVSDVPTDVDTTGLVDGTHELWIASDRSAIYLVENDKAAVLPLDESSSAADCA